MPRRAAANRREVQPDARTTVWSRSSSIRFCLDGKKSTAERIVYSAFDIVAEKTRTAMRLLSLRRQ